MHDGRNGTGRLHGHDGIRQAGVMGYASPLDLKDELKLTVEQVAKLKPMHAEYRKAIIRKSAEVKAANIDLRSFCPPRRSTTPSREAGEGDRGLKSGLMLSRVEALKKVQGVLTPGAVREVPREGPAA